MKPAITHPHRCSLTSDPNAVGRVTPVRAARLPNEPAAILGAHAHQLRTPSLCRADGRLVERAFSLLEIMVVVSLLSLIVYGLYAMFDRTQRALRANTSQVDILESGRAALDVLSREFEQAVASGLPDTNLIAPHLFARVDFTNSPLIQELVDGTTRTNLLQSVFFLSRPYSQWKANGFFVASVTNAANGPVLTQDHVNQIGVGTLYRFVYPPPTNAQSFQLSGIYRLSVPQARNWTNLFQIIKGEPSLLGGTNTLLVYPVTENVVHFRVRPYDANSVMITSSNYVYPFKGQLYTNTFHAHFLPERIAQRTVYGNRFYFYSNSMPSFLELELGILDPQVVRRVKAMPLAAQKKYLANQVGAVHLFHKLIPLRNTQP